MGIDAITRVDARPTPPRKYEEVRLFAVVKDEVLRLPYFVRYYRERGVQRFFFIDNDSRDGTRQFLIEQPDCHVFHTSGSYSEAASGVKWSNALLNSFGTGHWCLIVDADELFVYPHCETLTLGRLSEFLDTENSEAVFTFMLDMYPQGSLSGAHCTPDKPFFEICPLFDRDYKFVRRLHLRGAAPFPPYEVIGGPRARCFYGYQGENCRAWRLFMHIIERGVYFSNRAGISVPYIGLKAPALFKVPLIKWREGLCLTTSTHNLQKVRLSGVTGTLLHFKFFSDFHDRAVAAVASGEFAQGSGEYRRYISRLAGIDNLVYEGSIYYRSSDDVLHAGLMTTTETFSKIAKNAEKVSS